jgi:hypothetical protein
MFLSFGGTLFVKPLLETDSETKCMCFILNYKKKPNENDK